MVEIVGNDRNGSRRSSKVVEVFVVAKDNNNTSKDVESGDASKSPADFETAIALAGYGRFNLLLLLCAFPGFSTCVYVTTALSYVTSSAECDLNLSMVDMGRLNIITYAGMVCSAMLWGFLSDTLGRKQIMVWGFLAVGVCELGASLSQAYWVLLSSKFLTGFFFNGPFAVLISYISELHSASVRAKVLVYLGAFYAVGNTNLPLIAWSIIPQEWDIQLFGGYIVLHSWHVFLSLFSLCPLAASLAMACLPESPKFLMSRGRNQEALAVFRKIFSMNTGLPPEQYPVKELEEELGGDAGKVLPRGWEAVRGGLQQMRPLVLPPHLSNILLICFIHATATFGGNTLRLWFPQIATIIGDYNSRSSDHSSTMCDILSGHVANKSDSLLHVDHPLLDCVKLDTGATTYVNSAIIGLGTMVGYLTGGAIISAVGKRRLACSTLIISGLCSFCLFWSSSLLETVALFTVFISVAGVGCNVLFSVTVDMFPTAIRAMAVALLLMCGRVGTITGGSVFPYLLSLGCYAPFLFIGIIMIVGGLLCFVLPSTSQKKME